MVRGNVLLRFRPELVVVLTFEDLAAHAGKSLDSARTLHTRILGASGHAGGVPSYAHAGFLWRGEKRRGEHRTEERQRRENEERDPVAFARSTSAWTKLSSTLSADERATLHALLGRLAATTIPGTRRPPPTSPPDRRRGYSGT
jgi:hypothetical protein